MQACCLTCSIHCSVCSSCALDSCQGSERHMVMFGSAWTMRLRDAPRCEHLAHSMCKASMALHCQGASRMPYAMSRFATAALQL